MEKNKLIKAAIFGALLGIITEFMIRPLIEKPIEAKIEQVL